MWKFRKSSGYEKAVKAKVRYNVSVEFKRQKKISKKRGADEAKSRFTDQLTYPTPLGWQLARDVCSVVVDAFPATFQRGYFRLLLGRKVDSTDWAWITTLLKRRDLRKLNSNSVDGVYQ